jgi:hypothetical protein
LIESRVLPIELRRVASGSASMMPCRVCERALMRPVPRVGDRRGWPAKEALVDCSGEVE